MDYSIYSKSELIRFCESKGVSYSSTMSEQQLIQILVDHDNVIRNQVQADFFNPNFLLDSETPLVRGYRHNTIFVFLGLILAAFVEPFILIGSFFYWPLIRRWYRFMGEYYWTWVVYLAMVIMSIYMFMLMFVFAITIVFIPVSIILFFYWKSMMKGMQIATASRTIYVRQFIYGQAPMMNQQTNYNYNSTNGYETTYNQNTTNQPTKPATHEKETITSMSKAPLVTKKSSKELKEELDRNKSIDK